MERSRSRGGHTRVNALLRMLDDKDFRCYHWYDLDHPPVCLCFFDLVFTFTYVSTFCTM